MKKVKRTIEEWQCEFCGWVAEPEHLEDHEKYCERHQLEKLVGKWLDALETEDYTKQTDKYTKRCNVCTKTLLEFNSYWDGHRNEVGDLMFKTDYQTIRGRYFCKEHYPVVWLKLKKYLKRKGLYEKALELSVI